MAVRQLAPVLHFLRRVRGEAADVRLLEQFVERGDEAAFATLLQRYGPMVFGVCRRVLRDRHDAEDAFQATFLLLVRKARSLRQPELLGHWLYGVAYRTALKAKSWASRRRTDEANLSDVAAAPTDDLIWRDLRPVLDDAINDLPAKYRVPFVLCYLQGLTNAQAARQMGCPEGTVATRLSRARQRLRTRLTKHGLGVAAGAMALGVWSNTASATLPALLLVSTLRIATVCRTGTTPLAGEIPVKVAALTEGVSKAMFMAKLRFALITGILVAATLGGAGVWTFGALGSEPPSAAQQPGARVAPPAAPAPQEIPPPPVIPPAVATPAAVVRDEPAAVVYTENFTVHAPSRRIAQLVGEAAERFRKSEATRWLGKELPAWDERCPLRVTITQGGTGGATSFAFDGGKVQSRDMRLEGPLDRILSNCLPHEVTHTVLADHFRAPIPRWADEGAAVMAEDEEEQQRHEKLLWQLAGLSVGLTYDEARSYRGAGTEGRLAGKADRLIPLARLLKMKDFPSDVMALYCEGYSLTRFLVEKKDRKTFLAFVAQGMKDDGWNKAVKKHYGFEDVDALEEAWLAQVKKDARARPRPPEEEQPVIKSAPPTFGRASLFDKDGGVIVRMPVTYYEPTTRKVDVGATLERYETTYELKVSEEVLRLGPKEYEATDLDGKAIDKNDLAKRLQAETPVLIAFDGKKVDPYYLKVVREGTIILLPDVKEAVQVAPRRPQIPVPQAAPVVPKSVGH